MKKINNGNLLKIFVFAFACLVSLSVNAQDDFTTIKNEVVKNQPNLAEYDIDILRELSDFGLEGYYEATIEGVNVVIFPDLKYLVQGDLVEIETLNNVSLELRENNLNDKFMSAIEQLDEDNIIRNEHRNQFEHIGDMYAFIDPSKPMDRIFYDNLEYYLEAGINVNFIIYSQDQPNKKSKHKQSLAKILCSEKQGYYLDRYITFSRSSELVFDRIDGRKCENLIEENIQARESISDKKESPLLYLSIGKSFNGVPMNKEVIVDYFLNDK